MSVKNCSSNWKHATVECPNKNARQASLSGDKETMTISSICIQDPFQRLTDAYIRVYTQVICTARLTRSSKYTHCKRKNSSDGLKHNTAVCLYSTWRMSNCQCQQLLWYDNILTTYTDLEGDTHFAYVQALRDQPVSLWPGSCWVAGHEGYCIHWAKLKVGWNFHIADWKSAEANKSMRLYVCQVDDFCIKKQHLESSSLIPRLATSVLRTLRLNY
jgi:hypothetical protein